MRTKPREGTGPWRKRWAFLGRQCITCNMVVSWEQGWERLRYWEGLRMHQFQCKDCAKADDD